MTTLWFTFTCFCCILWLTVVTVFSSSLGDQASDVLSLVRDLLRLGKVDESLLTLQRILPKYPQNSELHFLNGAIRQSQGNTKEALSCYAKSLQLEPHQYSVLYNVGLIHRHAKRPTAARQFFNKALLERPNCALTINNIGLTYHAEQENTEAVKWFSRALILAKSNNTTQGKQSNATQAEIHFNLGVCYSKLGQIYHAESAYHAAMETDTAGGDIWRSAALNLAALCTSTISPKDRINVFDDSNYSIQIDLTFIFMLFTC